MRRKMIRIWKEAKHTLKKKKIRSKIMDILTANEKHTASVELK